jgi:two-component system LytT family response regulator
MTEMEGALDPRRFLRIHRSTIVNIERIREFKPMLHGDYGVVLRNGTELMLSRNYRHKVPPFLGNAL